MSFSEIRKFLIEMQSDEDLKEQVTTSSTADDVALIGQSLGYDFSGDDLLRFNGQKVDKVTVRKVDHPGEYRLNPYCKPSAPASSTQPIIFSANSYK